MTSHRFDFWTLLLMGCLSAADRGDPAIYFSLIYGLVLPMPETIDE